MPDGPHNGDSRHKSLESGVMRKYHAPFGGRPTEKDYPVVPRRRPTLRNVQGWNLTLVGSTSVRRRPRQPQVKLVRVVRLGREPMANVAIQGHECGAYVALFVSQ